MISAAVRRDGDGGRTYDADGGADGVRRDHGGFRAAPARGKGSPDFDGEGERERRRIIRVQRDPSLSVDERVNE
jgi:hypothetical protein